MKPLNYKERDSKFLKFVFSAIFTLGVTIFCIYYTNYLLTDAMAVCRVNEYSQFQNYKRNQQQYTRQLDQIGKSLSGANASTLITDNLVNDFKLSYTKNGDTSILMTKIVNLSKSNLNLAEQKNITGIKLINLRSDLKKCEVGLKTNPNQ